LLRSIIKTYTKSYTYYLQNRWLQWSSSWSW